MLHSTELRPIAVCCGAALVQKRAIAINWNNDRINETAIAAINNKLSHQRLVVEKGDRATRHEFAILRLQAYKSCKFPNSRSWLSISLALEGGPSSVPGGEGGGGKGLATAAHVELS